ncbi:hypothetical protein JAO16_02050 [Escherichia coli]|uniref:hypothetical protein n=1 Tax=Escherichia coli TaxID=562 RepID=UPI0018DB846B|nr:hypothetical protein [Escherichia coli]MBH9599626.1 hypothetical protein [Escherichia coli]HAL9791058.1 hypothetical protein [Escherichia coli]
MSFIENSFDGQDYDKIRAQKDFKKELDLKVEEIMNDLPEILRPIVAKAAKELAENVPDVLLKEDPVTHDTLDEKSIFMRMSMVVSNKLGHGASWLK